MVKFVFALIGCVVAAGGCSSTPPTMAERIANEQLIDQECRDQGNFARLIAGMLEMGLSVSSIESLITHPTSIQQAIQHRETADRVSPDKAYARTAEICVAAASCG